MGRVNTITLSAPPVLILKMTSLHAENSSEQEPTQFLAYPYPQRSYCEDLKTPLFNFEELEIITY